MSFKTQKLNDKLNGNKMYRNPSVNPSAPPVMILRNKN